MVKQQIINFVVNDDKFEILKAKINRFNPLKVLRVQDHEIRHSNVLAWIFNPIENHNFDDRILKRFLLKILLKPENDKVLENMEMVYELQQLSLMDIKAHREVGNIDLTLVSEQNKKVIFIENKVYSNEHSNQLEKYLKYIKESYPGYQIIPIFLTLNCIESSNGNFFLASYEDILETIEFNITNYKERTSTDVISFLEHYLITLKEKYVMDVELEKLCKEIYQQNKEVIDMIYTVGNQIDIAPATDKFIIKHNNIIPVATKNRIFWFGLDTFNKGRSTKTDIWGGGFPVCFWFAEYYGKLKITLEVGPFEDPNKRIDFLNQLQSKGIHITERSKEQGRKYTRIYTKTQSISDWTDHDEIADTMDLMFSNIEIKRMETILALVIDGFNW